MWVYVCVYDILCEQIVHLYVMVKNLILHINYNLVVSPILAGYRYTQIYAPITTYIFIYVLTDTHTYTYI